MPRTLLLSALLAVMAMGCSSGPSKRLAALEGVDTTGMITLARALEIAQGRVPDGFALEAKLELDDDDENEPPAWEVALYVAAQAQVIEVEVHAMTGAVLEVEVEEDGAEEDD